jgi:anti-sigma factor RsiW
MRHIPEDELHAYLDQALSRTQCVEIESHLADCPSCRATRDGIAALRDRTTALLSRLAPPPSFPPAFDRLRRLAAEVESQRRRRLHVVAWVASLVVALGLGWSASSLVRSRAERVAPSVARTPAGMPSAVASQAPDSRPGAFRRGSRESSSAPRGQTWWRRHHARVYPDPEPGTTRPLPRAVTSWRRPTTPPAPRARRP